jgi:hypothetical protein
VRKTLSVDDKALPDKCEKCKWKDQAKSYLSPSDLEYCLRSRYIVQDGAS